MIKHIVIRIEFDLLTNLFGILLRVGYQVVPNVTITVLAKIQHFCIRNERTTELSVSVGRLPKQLVTSRELPSSGLRNGNSPRG
jgi:hypothetical protein